jgi:hypothetical protein
MYPFNAAAAKALIDQHQREIREVAARQRLARQARRRPTGRSVAGTWRAAIAGLWTGSPTLDTA